MLGTRDEIRDADLRLSASERTWLLVELIDSFGDGPEGLSDDSPDLETELDRRAADRDGLVSLEELRESE